VDAHRRAAAAIPPEGRQPLRRPGAHRSPHQVAGCCETLDPVNPACGPTRSAGGRVLLRCIARCCCTPSLIHAAVHAHRHGTR
jgi:hypothetical protein